MLPLGRGAFTPPVKDKGEQCELKNLSLDSQSLSPLDKEKSVETEILRLHKNSTIRFFNLLKIGPKDY